MTSFPNNVWNGESSHRNTPYINRKPDYVDWNRIVDELIATQAYIKYLETLITGGGGETPLALGGSLGQVQFNNGSTLGGFNGSVLTNDVNGPTDAVAIGIGSFALGEQSVAIGNGCIASTDQSVAMGNQCVAGDPPRACTISPDGLTVTITGDDYTFWFYSGTGILVLSRLSGGTGPTIAYGSIDDTAPSNGVVFDGTNTVLTLVESVTVHTSGFVNMRDDNVSSHAEGLSTTASGSYTHSEGFITTASGGIAHAEGFSTTASGGIAHSEGYSTTASGDNSHAEGGSTTASGYISHAQGEYTTSSGEASHAEGTTTTASGDYSHAEGSGTTASGIGTHAEGVATIASGEAAHAGGRNSIASLFCQWARSDGLFGQVSQVIVSGSSLDTSPITLLINQSDQVIVPTNQVSAFIIQIVGLKTDFSAVATFIRQGYIINNAGVMTVSSINTIGTDVNPSSWTVTITADTENQALNISVVGEDTVHWKAKIDFVEVN